jgi:hypothetical protein
MIIKKRSKIRDKPGEQTDRKTDREKKKNHKTKIGRTEYGDNKQ